ncbi:MAG: hypothetical protein OXF41_09500 [bacterium]|nr:hypothetical protein [bacterium]
MSREAIAGFWAAWPRLAPTLEDELVAGRYGEGTEALTDLVEAMDPGLEWDLLPGREAAYALCLSSSADLALRPLAERWFQAAPPVDMVWEYHPARIPVKPAVVQVGDRRFDPLDVTVVIEPDHSTEELGLTVGHRRFGLMDEALQLQVVFRLLDDLLGEDGLETWVGSVDVVPHRLPWGIPFVDLAGEVDRLAGSATGKQWELMPRDDYELGESQVFINRALKRLHFLDMENIVILSIETSTADDPLLRQVEEDLAAGLRSEGVIFAHQVFDAFTEIYAYAAPGTEETLAELEDRWRPVVYNVVVDPDPAWDTYEDLR